MYIYICVIINVVVVIVTINCYYYYYMSYIVLYTYTYETSNQLRLQSICPSNGSPWISRVPATKRLINVEKPWKFP